MHTFRCPKHCFSMRGAHGLRSGPRSASAPRPQASGRGFPEGAPRCVRPRFPAPSSRSLLCRSRFQRSARARPWPRRSQASWIMARRPRGQRRQPIPSAPCAWLPSPRCLLSPRPQRCRRRAHPRPGSAPPGATGSPAFARVAAARSETATRVQTVSAARLACTRRAAASGRAAASVIWKRAPPGCPGRAPGATAPRASSLCVYFQRELVAPPPSLRRGSPGGFLRRLLRGAALLLGCVSDERRRAAGLPVDGEGVLLQRHGAPVACPGRTAATSRGDHAERKGRP
jgi:hypothetical protein